MAKHIATYAEVVSAKNDLRKVITFLSKSGYGTDSRTEAKDMYNLRIRLADLRHYSYQGHTAAFIRQD